MLEILYISTVPIEEPCLQVGLASYEQMLAEARAYAAGLRDFFQTHDTQVGIRVQRENHDFGSYPSVQIIFPEDDEAACELAYKIESSEPNTWEELGVAKPLPELDHLRS